MASCGICGRTFDSERARYLHRQNDHTAAERGDTIRVTAADRRRIARREAERRAQDAERRAREDQPRPRRKSARRRTQLGIRFRFRL